MTALSDWEDILSSFRALGGIADNVALRSESGRRGLYASSPDKPFKLFIPSEVLINTDDIELRDAQMVLKPSADTLPEVRKFFDSYSAGISWKDGKAEAEEFLSGLYELPDELRQFLRDQFYFKDIFTKPSDIDVLNQYVISRRYQHADKLVLFPMVELANHHPKGHPFTSADGGVLVEGTTRSEILVSYNLSDSWSRFATYGFPSRERYAFSDLYKVKPQKGSHSINVRKALGETVRSGDGVIAPLIKQTGLEVDISHLLLGDRADPTRPINMFRDQVKKSLGGGSDEFFEMLSYMNKMKFWKLNDICSRHNGPMVSKIRLACQFQLEALDYAWFGNWVPTDEG